jgi:hypothetical protein
MLVSHPRISISTDWIGAKVKVEVGKATVGVAEGGGIWLAVSVTGESIVTAGVIEAGGGIMKGVAVIMLGVEDGAAVQTGKGWGGTPHVSHAASVRRKRSGSSFFMRVLYRMMDWELF